MNHPLPRTSTYFLEEQIRQGTDVLIALMVLVAQSFVPASLVLALVQERRRSTKHLQMLCGLDGTVYWLANYAWDLVSGAVGGFSWRGWGRRYTVALKLKVQTCADF